MCHNETLICNSYWTVCEKYLLLEFFYATVFAMPEKMISKIGRNL